MTPTRSADFEIKISMKAFSMSSTIKSLMMGISNVFIVSPGSKVSSTDSDS